MSEPRLPTWRCSECEDVVVAAEQPDCPDHGPMVKVCEICLDDISDLRSDAITCGGPCRAESSRRRRSSDPRAQAHIAARRQRGTRSKPRRRYDRPPEKGARLYLLPDELEQAIAPSRSAAAKDARNRLEVKLIAARRRLEGRASRGAPAARSTRRASR